MIDLENRVSKLEDKVKQLEIDINKSLGEIKATLGEIKTTLEANSNNGDLKNELIAKDVKNNTTRLEKLEGNQAKVVWAIVSAFITLLIEAVTLYIKTK